MIPYTKKSVKNFSGVFLHFPIKISNCQPRIPSGFSLFPLFMVKEGRIIENRQKKRKNFLKRYGMRGRNML